MPSTSQPSVGDFLAVYEPLLEAGRDIVSIHLCAGISGTVHRRRAGARPARRARDRRPSGIVVLDSATACAGLGMMAIAAASVGRAGGATAERRPRPPRRCPARAQGLVRGRHARVPAPRRPRRRRAGVARLDAEDQADPLDRVGDPADRARAHVEAHVRAPDRVPEGRATTTGCDTFFIQHIHAPDQAERLVERGREIYGREPEFVSEIGPVIGAHVGPGLLGVSGMRRSCCTRAARRPSARRRRRSARRRRRCA